MQIRLRTEVTQVHFDREYTGAISVMIPDRNIKREFKVKLTDPAGERLRLEITNGETSFITIQAGGDDDAVKQQLERLPRGRQLVFGLFFQAVMDGYGGARINHADPYDRARNEEAASLLARFGGSVEHKGICEQSVTATKPDEFEEICRELRA